MSNQNSAENKFFNRKISELVSITHHYDEKTLMTKNADLVQTIKVRGFVEKELSCSGINLREEVRKSIKLHVKAEEFAVYLHVAREYTSVMPKPYEGAEKLVNIIEDAWCKENSWDRQLVNTLYITIVRQGPKISFFSVSDFLISVTPFMLKKKYKVHFAKSIKELTEVTSNIQKDLKVFFSKTLSVINEGGTFYSEPLSFYYYLTHLSEKKIELKNCDFSELLSDIKIKSEFNVFSLQYEDQKRHAAIYSIVMSSERSREFLDNILQSKTQFLLSEFITFVSAKKALARIEQYKKTLTSVKSVKMAGDLYINDALDLNTGSANDFCASQISIILYADDHNILQKRIENFSKILNEVGLKVVREDFNMQIAFFNALPGNTFYSNRASYLPTLFAAPFSDIHSKQNGSYNGSKWGDPVTILKTTKDHHYNFNFHYKDNGNTIIIGPKGTGKTTLTHFLLAQSLKFDVKIIYIDLEGRCSNFIKAINGKIIKLSQDTISPVQIDILNIDNYAGKSKWMAELLLKICEGDGSYMCNNKSYIEKFQDLTKKLIAIEGNEEKIKYLDSFINGFSDLTIKTNYKNFFKASFFNKFFGKDIVEDFTQNKYLGIDLSSISNVRSLFRPFLGLLLAKTQSFLMGQKTIIVINHDHNIFDAYTFQNQVEEWLENLTRNNAILLLAQQNDTIKAVYEKFAKILPYFASTICLSNKIMDKEIKYIFNLSNQEAHYISGNDKEKRKFLLKHGEDSVFTKVNLSNLKEVLKYLD